MRWTEIVESTNLDEAAANLPSKYMVDPDTDLALNLPNQWSQSPYLGAVKSKNNKGYMAQIHIPQAVWLKMVDQNPSKWRDAPQSFFQHTGNQRAPMIVSGFSDPRQAAYFTQEVLYGGDHSAQDIIEDYFEERYAGGDGALWRSIKAQVPSFDGQALTSADEQEFFASNQERKKADMVKQNTAQYDQAMIPKIKKAMVDFYSRNRALAAKRLGKFKSLNDLEKIIDSVIDQKGVGYFVTGPGSVKIKDIASLNF